MKGTGSGNPNATMWYADYERRIEAKYGWRLIGWPEIAAFEPPSQMGSGGVGAIKMLWERLRSGECHWVKLPDATVQALRSKKKDHRRAKKEKTEVTAEEGHTDQEQRAAGKRKRVTWTHEEPRPASGAKSTGRKHRAIGEDEEEPSRKKAKGASSFAGQVTSSEAKVGAKPKPRGEATNHATGEGSGKPQRSPKRLSEIEAGESSESDDESTSTTP